MSVLIRILHANDLIAEAGTVLEGLRRAGLELATSGESALRTTDDQVRQAGGAPA